MWCKGISAVDRWTFPAEETGDTENSCDPRYAVGSMILTKIIQTARPEHKQEKLILEVVGHNMLWRRLMLST